MAFQDGILIGTLYNRASRKRYPWGKLPYTEDRYKHVRAFIEQRRDDDLLSKIRPLLKGLGGLYAGRKARKYSLQSIWEPVRIGSDPFGDRPQKGYNLVKSIVRHTRNGKTDRFTLESYLG